MDNAIAFIVGNNDYQCGSDRNKLDNAVNDAKCISDKLFRLGFQTICKTDCTGEDFERHLLEFHERIQNCDVALFYFSGHGLQIEGQNHLCMIDTSFADSISAKHTSCKLDEVIDYMQDGPCRIKILIIDACRDNPLPERGINAGLAPIKAPKGTLIAFSTSPGERAQDGGYGKNSIYTGALLKHLDDRNIKIEEFFKRVRTTVDTLTKGKQTSWEHTSMIGEFCFNSGQIVHSMSNPYSEIVVCPCNFISDGSEIHELISSIRILDWNVQNPAIENLWRYHPSKFDKDSQFLLGRALYAAAEYNNSFPALNIFERLEEWLKKWQDGDNNHVLNGMLFQIYFDDEGHLHKEIRSSKINELCNLEGNRNYENSFNFIAAQLEPYADRLFYIPSMEATSTAVNLNFIEGKYGETIVNVIEFNGENVYSDNDPFREGSSINELKDKLGYAMCVPKKHLTLNYSFPEDCRFVEIPRWIRRKG